MPTAFKLWPNKQGKDRGSWALYVCRQEPLKTGLSICQTASASEQIGRPREVLGSPSFRRSIEAVAQLATQTHGSWGLAASGSVKPRRWNWET